MILSPLGVKIGWISLDPRAVSRVWFAPFALMLYISKFPSRNDWKTIFELEAEWKKSKGYT